MPEMTKGERIACVFAHEVPDRVPVFDWVSHVALIGKVAGRPLTLQNAGEVIPLANHRLLDLAPVWLPADPRRHVDERGFTVEGAGLFNHWVVERSWRDFGGMIAWVERQIEELRAWRPPDDEAVAVRRQERRALLARYGAMPVAGHLSEPLEAAFPAVGLENFSYLLADRPELAQAWLEALHARNLADLQAGADPAHDPALYPVICLTGDVAFKGRPIFSPAYLRRSGYFRRIAQVCRLLHERGVKVLYHSDGDLTAILPDLVAAGIDALNPIDLGAGMDLGQVKAAYGRQLVLVGGVDGAYALPFGTLEEVRQATRRALQAAMPGGGYILGSSGAEWLDGLPMHNLEAMLETVWKEGRY
jgi:uroporphyrinogen decarboxylase